MAAIRIPGTLFSIWFVSPCPMKPAPTIPTRMGFPCSWRALSALSTMIMVSSPCGLAVVRHPPLQLRLDLVERLPGAVLRGDFSDGQRPLEAEAARSEEHTSELQSPCNLVCRLLLEKKKKKIIYNQQSHKTKKKTQ